MILGIAQLIVNVADLDGAAADLEHRGYRESFRELRLPNAEEKHILQGAARDRLDMIHFAAPEETMAIELTRYAGAPPTGRAAYRIELTESGTVERVVAEVPDPAASVAFWQEGLGFRAAETRDGWQLDHPALVPAWRLSLTLVPATGPTLEPATVDADGCVLVTALTTDAAADLARLRELGARRATEVWSERVSQRPLRVAMVEAPGGELVELLELPRERAG